MRNILLASAVLGVVTLSGAAQAAPGVRGRAALAAPHAQTVQYRDPDWREHEAARHRREEEERRHEAWRREHERHEYHQSEVRPPYGPRY